MNSGLLAMNLPSCPSYPSAQSTVQIQSACDACMELIQKRKDLMQKLALERSGESIVRRQLAGSTHALNINVGIVKERRVIGL